MTYLLKGRRVSERLYGFSGGTFRLTVDPMNFYPDFAAGNIIPTFARAKAKPIIPSVFCSLSFCYYTIHFLNIDFSMTDFRKVSVDCHFLGGSEEKVCGLEVVIRKV